MSDASDGRPGAHQALIRNTGYLVSRLGWFAQRHFAERIAEAGLNPRMWGALNVLDAEGPVTQQQLGRAIAMDPSTMVSTIDELEAQGLVERRRHPNDRRAYALHITDAGRETLTRGRRLAGAAQQELLAPLSASEREQFHALMLKLVLAAGERSAAPIPETDPPPAGPSATGPSATGPSAA